MTAISKEFVLAGRAIFTVELPAGSPTPHYTYRIDRVEASDRWPETWFAKLLTGPDNETSYTYVGRLDAFTGQVAPTAKSRMTADTYAVRLLNRILARVWSGDHVAYERHGFRTHHEGCCGRCGRRLTVPASIESGIGPECAKAMAS